MVRDSIRQAWSEPRLAAPAEQPLLLWLAVAVFGLAGLLEASLRSNLGWPPVAAALGLVPVAALFWRRTHPLWCVAVVSGAHAASEAVALVGGQDAYIYATVSLLLAYPYWLFRWGGGRECVLGVSVLLVSHVPGGATTTDTAAGVVAATVVLLFPCVLGAAVRYRATSRSRAVEQVKAKERELLARELHDTVAHHVSAIIVQAQAGRAVAATKPEATSAVLEAIEAEASRSLTEMRAMVGVLRYGEDADTAPQRGVADIAQLARSKGKPPQVVVSLSGRLDDLLPSASATLYRLAQEAITNALRHARNATRIEVRVHGDERWVHLTVTDDGEPNSFGPGAQPGYGIIGMTERAHLLGGVLQAGPSTGRGWTVTAALPNHRPGP